MNLLDPPLCLVLAEGREVAARLSIQSKVSVLNSKVCDDLNVNSLRETSRR